MSRNLLRPLILLLLTAGLTLPVQAKGLRLPELQVSDQSMGLMHDSQHNKRPSISREEAVRRARKQYPGKVLSVKQRGDHYAVKIIKNGRVRVINVSSNR